MGSTEEQWRIGDKGQECQYDGAVVPTVLYGAEAWGMRSAEGMKVNVLETKHSRSLVEMSRMDC